MLQSIRHQVLVFTETQKFFDALCVKHNVDCPAPRTTARLIDKVLEVKPYIFTWLTVKLI